MIKELRALVLVLVALLAPSLSFAHTIDGGGYVVDLLHPFLGIDHLLTIVAVGIIAAAMYAYLRTRKPH